jgi:DHA1 family tetracycline resistance protein-like MFS transporter
VTTEGSPSPLPDPAWRRPQATRRALAFIFVTVLLDMIGFGIVIPVIPELIRELTGEGLARAAIYGGWLLFVYGAMQFLFAPIIGNLSDRFGRRPILLFSLSMFSLDYLLMGFSPTLLWLFAGRMLAGVAGATGATASAYVADISPPEERAANFGLIGAAFGLGFIIGPVLGGFLGEYGPRVPFFGAALLAALNVVYGLMVLPETLPRHERRAFDLRRASPLGALLQIRRYPLVAGLFMALVFYQLAHDASPSTWSYYTMLKFDWSERDVGYSLGFVGVMFAFVQGGLIRYVIPWLGEERAGYFGLSMMTLGFLGIAFSTESWMMYLFIVPFTLGGIATAAARGIMSNAVPANAQGELQGATTSLMSLTAIVAPLLMTQLFGYFSSDAAPIYFPGAPFLVAAMLTVVSFFVFMRVMRRARSAMAQPGSASERAPR